MDYAIAIPIAGLLLGALPHVGAAWRKFRDWRKRRRRERNRFGGATVDAPRGTRRGCGSL